MSETLANARSEGQAPSSSWVAGGGEMAGEIAASDWTATALGTLQEWPHTLRAALIHCLQARLPSAIWWGEQAIQLYNDAYRALLGAKHPAALGRPAAGCWAEAWPVLGPLYDRVRTSGETAWLQDLRISDQRIGGGEQSFFTLSCNAIRDDSGGVGGVQITCTETTDRISSDRLRQNAGASSGQAGGASAADVSWKADMRRTVDVGPAQRIDEATWKRLQILRESVEALRANARVRGELVSIQSQATLERVRGRAQRELHRIEARHRQLLRLLPVGVYTVEAPSGLITFYNEHAAALWGRSPGAGDTDEHFCAAFMLFGPVGTQASYAEAPMALALAEGRRFRNVEADIERPDGTRITVLVNIDPVLDAEGCVVGAIVAFRDVTDLKAAEGAVRISEERFRAFVSATSLGVYRMNADWSQMFRLQGSAFLADTVEPSRSWLEKYVHPDDRCLVQETIQRAIRDQSVFELEHRVIRKDGTLGWTSSRAVPLLGPGGSVLEWVGAAIDITERKRGEAAARALLEGEVRQRTLELWAVNALLKRELSKTARAEALLAQSHHDLERRVAERTKWLRLLHDVTRMINAASSWDDALHRVLQRLCEVEDWQIGVLHLAKNSGADESGPPITWISDDRFQAFRESRIGVKSSNLGLLARRLVDENNCLWIEDPAELAATLGPCAAEASRAGLHACAVLPIAVGGEVLAVLELFSDRPHPRNDQLSALMRDVGEQVARILEREQATARMADIAWREQQSLLHTLHDSLGQTLTGLGMLSAGLHRQLTASAGPAADTAAEIARQAQIALDQVRQLTKSLFPIEVDPESLLTALRNLAAATESLHGIRVHVEGKAPPALHEGKIATELFRIVQEAVTNAVKHAKPETIRISIESRPGWTELRVVDDGIGIRSSEPHNGNGLRIMQHRAASIGARLSLEPAAPHGTIVACTLRESPALPGERLSQSPRRGDETSSHHFYGVVRGRHTQMPARSCRAVARAVSRESDPE